MFTEILNAEDIPLSLTLIPMTNVQHFSLISGVGGALGILLAVTVTLLMLFKSKSGPHQSCFRTLQNNETYDDEAHEDLCSDTIDRSSMTV